VRPVEGVAAGYDPTPRCGDLAGRKAQSYEAHNLDFSGINAHNDPSFEKRSVIVVLSAGSLLPGSVRWRDPGVRFARGMSVRMSRGFTVGDVVDGVRSRWNPQLFSRPGNSLGV